MANSEKIRQALRQYSRKRPLYEALALRVSGILKDLMDGRAVNYHSVSSRAKAVDSYEKKASQEKYNDPENEIMDMAGIRVITYTQSEAEIVASLVKELFDIMSEYSVDKTEELGTDRVGYRSIHFVGTLGKARLKLPENQVFEGMRFEIQVRTILQHAWAEFEHDRNYKFAGVLPAKLKRRVSLLSGSLESIDSEFDSITHEMEDYTAAIKIKTESGDLEVPIDSTSLMAYLTRKFASLIQAGKLDPTLNNGDKDLVQALHDMGIRTLKELDSGIPSNFDTFEGKAAVDNFAGLLRNVMIILDADRYFEKAWNKHWNLMGNESVELLEEFGIDMSSLAEKYHIVISPGFS